MQFTTGDDVIVRGPAGRTLSTTVLLIDGSNALVHIPDSDKGAVFDGTTGELLYGGGLEEGARIEILDESAQETIRGVLHARLSLEEDLLSSRQIQDGFSIADLTRLSDLLDEITSGA